MAVAQAPTPGQAEYPTGFERRMVTLVVMLGALMAIVDTSIVNVALPSIGKDLHAGVSQLSLVATGFIIAGALVMPLIGWMNAFFGRKQFYMLTLGIFTLASIACGLAWSAESLALFRFLQGLGGGALVPASQAIMLESYPREQHGRAMSVFGMGVTAGPAFGPVLGGWITQTLSWEWVFLINVPLGIAALLLACRFLHNPPHREKPKGRFDWRGLITMVIGLTALQLVFEKGHDYGWFNSGLITALAILAILSLGMFIRHELRTAKPIVDLSVMRDRTFAMGSLINLMMGLSLFGTIVILPLFMVQVLGFETLEVGLALMPGAIATGAIMPLAGYLVGRIDPRLCIGMGLTISCLSLLVFARVPAHAGYWDLAWPQIMRGIGMGLMFIPMTTLTMSGLTTGRMAGASGLYTLIRQLGGSLGIAVLMTLLAFFQQLYQVGPQAASAAANLKAYHDVFLVSAGAFMLCFIPLALMRRGAHQADATPQ
jgi:DHA2 family multidrug resistance protein